MLYFSIVVRELNPEVTAVVLGSEPGSLARLCGISMLERMLRVLQRVGFSSVIVLNPTDEAISELEKPSWARHKLSIKCASELPEQAGPFLFVRGDVYCDQRILEALLNCGSPSVAIDTNPPKERAFLLTNAARFRNELACGAWLGQTAVLHDSDDVMMLDIAELPSYIGSIRRTIHPLWFPVPIAENTRLAENLILDAATKGTPDIPSIIQAPIETWITRQICTTGITPNQVTLFTAFLGILIAMEFYHGHWWSGLLMAVAFGVLDGVDGKLARVKAETTEVGKWEHYIDHALEYSWWLALARSLHHGLQLSHAWLFGFLVIAGDLLGKIVTRPVKAHTGKPSHDFSLFEQRLRLIGGRRDIYIGMLLIGLVLRVPGLAFAAVGCWSMITASIQTVRSIYICYFTPRLV